MKKNMGNTDRILRFIVAIAIVVLYFTHLVAGTLAVILLIAAAVFALTSMVSFCPLYYPFGINTCKKEPEH